MFYVSLVEIGKVSQVQARFVVSVVDRHNPTTRRPKVHSSHRIEWVARHQCSDPAPGGRPCGVPGFSERPDLNIVVTGSVVVQQFQIFLFPLIITNVLMIVHKEISKTCKYPHENVEISMCKYVNSNFQTI